MKFRFNNIQVYIILCISILFACQSNKNTISSKSPVSDTLIKIIVQNEFNKSEFSENKNVQKSLQINASNESGIVFIINQEEFTSSDERVIKENDKPVIIGNLSNDKNISGEYSIGFSNLGFGDLTLEIHNNNEVSIYKLPLQPQLITKTMETFYRMIEIEEIVQLFPLDSLIHLDQHNIKLARNAYPDVDRVIKTSDSSIFRQIIELERSIELKQKSAESFQKLGELYISIHDPELYVIINHCFVQSLNMGNTSVSLIYSLAYSEFLLGNYDKATDYYIKSKQLGWNNDIYDLHDRLEVYLLRRGY